MSQVRIALAGRVAARTGVCSDGDRLVGINGVIELCAEIGRCDQEQQTQKQRLSLHKVCLSASEAVGLARYVAWRGVKAGKNMVAETWSLKFYFAAILLPTSFRCRSHIQVVQSH